MEAQGHFIGGGYLPGQTDDGEAVGAVGGDFKLHHMVVGPDDRLQIVAGLDALLMEDEDAVGDAVGELGLLGTKVLQGADVFLLGVQGDQVPGVEVGAVGGHGDGAAAYLAGGGVGVHAVAAHGGDPGADHAAEDLVAELDVGGDGGLVLVQGVVVVQKGGRSDDGVGEVTGVQAQLREAAHHAVGDDTAQFTLFNLLTAGEGGLVQGNGDHVVGVNVPGAGDDLNRLFLTNVNLAHPHMVGVGVALHGQDLAHHHVGDLLPQVVGQLYLGAGEGHSLGKVFIIGVDGDKLAQPFSA